MGRVGWRGKLGRGEGRGEKYVMSSVGECDGVVVGGGVAACIVDAFMCVTYLYMLHELVGSSITSPQVLVSVMALQLQLEQLRVSCSEVRVGGGGAAGVVCEDSESWGLEVMRCLSVCCSVWVCVAAWGSVCSTCTLFECVLQFGVVCAEYFVTW